MTTKPTTPTTITPHPDSLRCIHRMIPQWCAVCNPPDGPRRKSIGVTQPSGRGVGNLWGDTRPVFTRKQFDETRG